MKIVVSNLLSLVVVFGLAGSLSAQLNNGAAKPAGQGDESLGGSLLDDLGPAAQPPAAVPQQPMNNPQRPAGERPRAFRVDQPTRFDDLGEDLGAPSGPLPLVRARQNMQTAGEILATAGNMTDARAAQDRVVAQLDELINGLCKQCQGGGSKPGEKPSQANKPAQPKPGAAKPGMSPIAARDSVEVPRPAGERQLSPAEREALIKQLWGHLPEREREKMMQTFSGEFLPKYELELEKYYQRLAEEKENPSR